MDVPHRLLRPGLLWLIPATLLWALPAGCSDDGGTTDPPPKEVPFFPDDYKSAYTLALTCRPFSIGHESNTVSIHVDPVSATQYTGRLFDDPLPEGTVIVKTEHNDINTCDTVVRITAMRKGPPGTAPGSGDWEWQELDGAGNVLQSGQITDCIDCHTEAECQPLDFTCWDGQQQALDPETFLRRE